MSTASSLADLLASQTTKIPFQFSPVDSWASTILLEKHTSIMDSLGSGALARTTPTLSVVSEMFPPSSIPTSVTTMVLTMASPSAVKLFLILRYPEVISFFSSNGAEFGVGIETEKYYVRSRVTVRTSYFAPRILEDPLGIVIVPVCSSFWMSRLRNGIGTNPVSITTEPRRGLFLPPMQALPKPWGRLHYVYTSTRTYATLAETRNARINNGVRCVWEGNGHQGEEPTTIPPSQLSMVGVTNAPAGLDEFAAQCTITLVPSNRSLPPIQTQALLPTAERPNARF